MSSWTTVAVRVTDESAFEDVTDALDSSFDIPWWETDGGVIGTTFAEESRQLSSDELERALRSVSDAISGVVVVAANDTSDTASGTVYEVDESGRFEKTRTQHSGGESTRRNWPGLSYDGLRVDGGKY